MKLKNYTSSGYTPTKKAVHINTYNNVFRTAFTLAEVLITLGVIGVVAALTIPSLINNNRAKALEAALKKNYSVIEQALNMYYAQNGERLNSETPEYTIKNAILPYFQIIRDCGRGSEASTEKKKKVYIPNYINNGDTSKNSTNYKTINGLSIINLQYFDDGQFVLNDGSIILIEHSTAKKRVYISVDVNGYLKPPNRLGKDLFMFQLDKEGKLLPMGAESTDYYSENEEYCSKTSTNNMNGAGCTYKALTDSKYFNYIKK